MLTALDVLLGSSLFEIEQCRDLKKLDEIRVAIFGKNGKLTEKMKALKSLSDEERKIVGAKINEVKSAIQEKLSACAQELEMQALEKKLANEIVDVTMPVPFKSFGYIHPITKVYKEIAEILRGYGFNYAEGPDIDDEYYNFTSLNIPEHHPARTMQDTFYLNSPAGENGRKLLRTQTSTIQNRVMINNQPPFRFYTIGRVFRSDYDATHTPMFDQVEGIIIEKDIGFAQLKWLMKDILKKFFNLDSLSIRFRPSFFPFTEPSAELDINYRIVDGKMKFGEGTDWLEVAGCGVTHPNVMRAGKIDTLKYQGVAFAFGIERLASLKYGIPDLRNYFESNEKWRETFGFSPADL